MHGEINIFEGSGHDSITPDDIKQGSLGDCYYLCSLSTLAERPYLVKRLFLTKNYNTEGVYGVFLCDTGDWRLVTVDDYFPCSSKRQGPCFSKANGNEMWVLLLEKAYAKIYGSYANIESGIVLNAMRDLTGAPGESLKIKERKPMDVFKWLLANHKKGFL